MKKSKNESFGKSKISKLLILFILSLFELIELTSLIFSSLDLSLFNGFSKLLSLFLSYIKGELILTILFSSTFLIFVPLKMKSFDCKIF